MKRVASGQLLGDRETQEDALQIVHQSESAQDGELLLLLSDGMGGHAGGEVASNLAVSAFVDHFQNVSTNMRPRGRLEESLRAANAAINQKIANDPSLSGMGCTLIAVLVVDGRLVWCSVGDSILYLMRKGQLKRINADHSYFGELMEMVARGELTEAEARNHPRKNALRSAIMGEDLKLIDLKVIDIRSGDVILLASDGIETLNDDEIAGIAHDHIGGGVEDVTQALLSAVADRERPKQDNTTLITLRVEGETNSTLQSDRKWDLQGRKSIGLLPIGIGAAAILGFAILGFVIFGGTEPELEPAPVVEAAPPREDVADSEPDSFLDVEPPAAPIDPEVPAPQDGDTAAPTQDEDTAPPTEVTPESGSENPPEGAQSAPDTPVSPPAAADADAVDENADEEGAPE